jgi:hypothetical protein
MTLLETLQEEKSSNLKGGIYHKTQLYGFYDKCQNPKVSSLQITIKPYSKIDFYEIMVIFKTVT